MLSSSERSMLLLCGDLGDGCRPVGIREFRDLSKRVLASELADPGRDMKIADFLSLGYNEEQAGRFFALMSREKRLEAKLTQLQMRGIWPLTRLSAGYPEQFIRAFGDAAPAVLFCAGSRDLLGKPAVSLVGSRDLSAQGGAFARRVGEAAAAEGLALVSGGAAGADRAGEDAALEKGGTVISFTAGSLYTDTKTRSAGLAGGTLLMLAQTGPYLSFSAARAQSRNRLIHAYSPRVFVAGAAFESGGSWSGAADNLKKARSLVFVFDDGSRGCSALISMGATPVRIGDLHGLMQIPAAAPAAQQRLY